MTVLIFDPTQPTTPDGQPIPSDWHEWGFGEKDLSRRFLRRGPLDGEDKNPPDINNPDTTGSNGGKPF